MARKLGLITMMALVTFFTAASLCFSDTYNLGSQGDNEYNTFVHIYSNTTPWGDNTQLSAGSPTYYEPNNWWVGHTASYPFISNSAIHSEDETGKIHFVTITFSLCNYSPAIYIKLMDNKEIISNNVSITMEAIYNYDKTYHLLDYDSITGIYSTITGIGMTLDGIPFKFIMSGLNDTFSNHQNRGFFESFTVIYPYEASAPPVPLPGSLVLLGSGLAGLAFMVRRRRRG